jgi:hypothetical protein
VLVGHAPSFPDSRCDRLAIDSASEAGGWPAAARPQTARLANEWVLKTLAKGRR